MTLEIIANGTFTNHAGQEVTLVNSVERVEHCYGNAEEFIFAYGEIYPTIEFTIREN